MTATALPTARAHSDVATIDAPLTLPCGVTLSNRIAKAAMSEVLGEISGAPSHTLVRLYSAWGRSGAGLLVTGNVMVDRRAHVEPRNVVLEDDRHLDAISRWERAGSQAGSVMLMQINHPGRTAVVPLHRRPVAPSPVPLSVSGLRLRTPRALTLDDIADLRRRFARTAELAVAAGFAGVQVHAAHGYLLSQFLSPAANQRIDAYGGSPENRRRLLLEIVADVRDAVGPERIVSVKLNSADFHRGGLTEDESVEVALALDAAGIDLLEISGGNYEAPAMVGAVKASTRVREAYFLGYARRVRAQADVPLMLTGGVRTRAFMDDVLAAGEVDLVGLARPFAIQPDVANRLLAGKDCPPAGSVPRVPTSLATPVNAWLQLSWHADLFRRIADGATELAGPGLARTLVDVGTRTTARALTTV